MGRIRAVICIEPADFAMPSRFGQPLHYCQMRGYDVIALAPSFEVACGMVGDGNADVIVVESRTVVCQHRLEIISMELPSGRPRPPDDDGPPGERQRRPSRLR